MYKGDQSVRRKHDKYKATRVVFRNGFNTLRPKQNGRHSPDDILNAFSWTKIYEFRLKFHWSSFLGVQLTISQYWFGQWLGGTRPITLRFELWPISTTAYEVMWTQCVKTLQDFWTVYVISGIISEVFFNMPPHSLSLGWILMTCVARNYQIPPWSSYAAWMLLHFTTIPFTFRKQISITLLIP